MSVGVLLTGSAILGVSAALFTVAAGLVVRLMVRRAIRRYSMDEARRAAHAVDGP